jgi:hypothetical protein
MKLNKEETQKLVLGGLLLCGLVYAYFDMLLGPLQRRQVAGKKQIEALTPKISAAKAEIARTRQLEAEAPQARATVAQISAMIPAGSPVAWFPPRMSDFFKAYGVERTATRMNNEFPEKDLPGYRRLTWGIDLPRVDFISFAAAVAQLENTEPLVEITSLQLDTSGEDAAAQRALLTVANIVHQ